MTPTIQPSQPSSGANLYDKATPTSPSPKIQIPPEKKKAIALAKKYVNNPNIVKIDTLAHWTRFHFKTGIIIEIGTAGEDNFDIILPNGFAIKNLGSGKKRAVMLRTKHNTPFSAHAHFGQLKEKSENLYEGFDKSINERGGGSARIQFKPVETTPLSPIPGEYKIDIATGRSKKPDKKHLKNKTDKNSSVLSRLRSLFKRKPAVAKEDLYKLELLKINPDGSFEFADPSLHDEVSKCFYRRWYDIGKDRFKPAPTPTATPSDDDIGTMKTQRDPVQPKK